MSFETQPIAYVSRGGEAESRLFHACVGAAFAVNPSRHFFVGARASHEWFDRDDGRIAETSNRVSLLFEMVTRRLGPSRPYFGVLAGFREDEWEDRDDPTWGGGNDSTVELGAVVGAHWDISGGWTFDTSLQATTGDGNRHVDFSSGWEDVTVRSVGLFVGVSNWR